MGFLTDTIAKVYQKTNEPSVDAKYGDDEIIQLIEEAWAAELPSLWANADNPTTIRWEFTVAPGTEHYALPPYVGEVIQIAEMDANKNIVSLLRPRSRWNPAGPGYEINGNTMSFVPLPSAGATYTMNFLPSGEIRLCEGFLTNDSTATALVLGEPSKGTRDGRVSNAYAGYLCRLTADDGRIEERNVLSSSFDGTDHVVNVGIPFGIDVTIDTTYEMIPISGISLRNLVAIAAAIAILQNEGLQSKEMAQVRAHRVEKDALLLRYSNMDSVVGQHFRGDTSDNPRLGTGLLGSMLEPY